MNALDDQLIPPMTVREALLMCFNDNWGNRRKVTVARGGETFTAYISHAITVPMELAKEVLAEIPR